MWYFVVVECGVVYVREVIYSALTNVFEVLYVDVVWSCRVVVLAAFDYCLDLFGCDVYLSIFLVIFLFVVLIL